jgi:rhamnulokinase
MRGTSGHRASERQPSYLAIDLGASSGRAVVGTLDGMRMHMQEVHRFRTPIVEEHGHLYWGIEALWRDVCTAIEKALYVAPALRSLSIDSWAVDYVPLAADGSALRRPFAYRDARTAGRLEEVVALLGADALYARTGTQFLPFNTLPQVVADLVDEPEVVTRTHARLLIADYLLYRLSGVLVAERTMASTTQLYDVAARTWASDVIEAIGDSPLRWPRLAEPGTILGPARLDGIGRPNDTPAMAVLTCSHDTAAAVAAVPARPDESWCYISSGTWSLVGLELTSPILSSAARTAGFTNEVGLDGTIRFLKNRAGMWVLEECMREWGEQGERPSYESLLAAATNAPVSVQTLDLDAPPFAARGDMPRKIATACRAHGAPEPRSRGELVRLILDSLAATYTRTLLELEALTGESVDVVHVVGGGARVRLLNQLTADACGRRVVAGPEEAATLGNLLVQARALGDLPPGVSVREAARASAEISEFVPVPRGKAPSATLITH